MTNIPPGLKIFVLYLLVLPLALLVGAVVGSGGSFNVFSGGLLLVLIAAVLAAPLLLKWHHQLLFLCWNTIAVVFFLPGRPQIWLAMAFGSLTLSVVQRSLSRDQKFFHVPSVWWAMAGIMLVMLVTGSVTGFGLAAFGAENVGGKGYWLIFGALAGLLAMTAQPIPREKANLYVGLFFLGSISTAISSVFSILPNVGQGLWWYIFLLFPVEAMPGAASDAEFSRFWGASVASVGILAYQLARYGFRGMFQWAHPFRFLIMASAMAIILIGGFRSLLILIAMTFAFTFFFEGLIRSKHGAVLLGLGVIMGALLVGFSSKLPVSVQRTISFLPVEIDPVARANADASTEWRKRMWRVLMPEVEKHLFFGKGLVVSDTSLHLTTQMVRSGVMQSEEEAMLAGSYHNGPLSLLIPFGIWGALAMVGFWWVALRAMNRNRLYGEDYLKNINTFLLSYFVARIVLFLVVFGDVRVDFPVFAGLLGLSLALNNGIRTPKMNEFAAEESDVQLPVVSPITQYSR